MSPLPSVSICSISSWFLCQAFLHQMSSKRPKCRLELTRDEIESRCNPSSFHRGFDLAKDAQHSLELRSSARLPGWDALVKTEYRVVVRQTMGEIRAQCTCPDERPDWCKHIAAVCLVGSLSQWERDMYGMSSSPRSLERAEWGESLDESLVRLEDQDEAADLALRESIVHNSSSTLPKLIHKLQVLTGDTCKPGKDFRGPATVMHDLRVKIKDEVPMNKLKWFHACWMSLNKPE